MRLIPIVANSWSMRVVLDTNILISACLKPNGLEALIVRMVLNGELQACVTDQVWAEYREVLLRAKFSAIHGRAEQMLEDLNRVVIRVTAGSAVSAASDEDDNRFLECAAAGGARFVVTGNLRHYPADWAGTRILNARAFLQLSHPGCII